MQLMPDEDAAPKQLVTNSRCCQVCLEQVPHRRLMLSGFVNDAFSAESNSICFLKMGDRSIFFRTRQLLHNHLVSSPLTLDMRDIFQDHYIVVGDTPKT